MTGVQTCALPICFPVTIGGGNCGVVFCAVFGVLVVRAGGVFWLDGGAGGDGRTYLALVFWFSRRQGCGHWRGGVGGVSSFVGAGRGLDLGGGGVQHQDFVVGGDCGVVFCAVFGVLVVRAGGVFWFDGGDLLSAKFGFSSFFRTSLSVL